MMKICMLFPKRVKGGRKMYFCYNEFNPFWFEFIPLSGNRNARSRKKRFSIRCRYKRINGDRHGEYATVPYSLMVQIGIFNRSFVIFFMKHWRPLPKWSLELLAQAREVEKR